MLKIITLNGSIKGHIISIRRLKIHKHQLSKIEKKGATQNIETVLEQINEMKSRSRHAYSISHNVISQGKANRGIKHQVTTENHRDI